MTTPEVKTRLTVEGEESVLAAFRKVQQEAAATGKKGASWIGVLSGALGGLRAAIPVVGFAAAAAAIVRIGKSAINAGDEIGKMAKRAASSSENVSTLAAAARTADVSNEDLQAGLVRTAKSMGELRDGTGESVEAFGRLGISAKDIKGLDTAKTLALVAERLAGVSDETERTALTLKILGRGGAALTPLLQDIAQKGFGALEAAAKSVGLFMTTEFTDKAEQFNDNLTLIQGNLLGFARGIVADVLPSLAKFTGELHAAQVAGGGLFRGLILQLGTDTNNLGGELEKVNAEITKAGAQIPPGLLQRKSFIQELIRLQQEADAKARGVGPQRGRIGFPDEKAPTAALKEYEAAQRRVLALDEQIAAVRARQRALTEDASLSTAGPGSQLIDLEKRAEARIVELKQAIAAGDVKSATKLQAELEALSGRIGGLDTVFAGDVAARVLKETNDAFLSLLETQRQVVAQQAAISREVASSLTAQLKEVEQKLAELTTKPSQLQLGLASSELQTITQQIRDHFASNPIPIAIKPVTAGGGGGGEPGFAGGGQVPGIAPHARADNVLARLTPGEFVMPVAAVKHYGAGLMEAMRTMDMRPISLRRFPGFADGGLVGDVAGSSTVPAGVTEIAITINGQRRGEKIWAEAEKLTRLADEIARQAAG